MFWSKSPSSKADKVAANKERDRRVRAHNLHMQNSQAQAETGAKSSGHVEMADPEAGLDEDVKSQLGRQKQVAKEIIHEKSKQLRSMRAGVRHSRRKARARGRSLGF